MQVKVGVLKTNREVVVESDQSPEEVESALTAALAGGTPLRLVDRDGSTTLIPAANIGYIEIGAGRRGGVGFGSL